jgi:hypothetical protein
MEVSLLTNVGWTPRPSEILRQTTDEATVLLILQQAAICPFVDVHFNVAYLAG